MTYDFVIFYEIIFLLHEYTLISVIYFENSWCCAQPQTIYFYCIQWACRGLNFLIVLLHRVTFLSFFLNLHSHNLANAFFLRPLPLSLPNNAIFHRVSQFILKAPSCIAHWKIPTVFVPLKFYNGFFAVSCFYGLLLIL